MWKNRSVDHSFINTFASNSGEKQKMKLFLIFFLWTSIWTEISRDSFRSRVDSVALMPGQQLVNFQSFRKVMLGTEKCENLAELWRTGLFLIPAQASTFLPHPVTSLLFPNCLFQLSSITLLLPWASFYKHFQLWPQVGRECFTYKNSHTHTHTHTHTHVLKSLWNNIYLPHLFYTFMFSILF